MLLKSSRNCVFVNKCYCKTLLYFLNKKDVFKQDFLQFLNESFDASGYLLLNI